MIKEIIVVEGKADIAKVKSAVDAEVIATGGFGYGDKFLRNLKKLAKRKGLIILTDPDFAGEQIRRRISQDLENCKHAFLPQGKALKDDDIGVENASKEDIRQAIERARPLREEKQAIYSRQDLVELGLVAGSGSREKREKIGDILGIGYCNAKQFLNRLNSFGIGREEFIQAYEKAEKEMGGF